MSVLYEIHLQHAGRDAACAQLQAALEAELRSLGLHAGQVSILENAAVAREAAEDPVSRVVAFLASGLWRLSVQGKSEAYFEVTPRPIWTRDLYACEQNRADVPDAYVLHGGVDYSPSDRKYIEWIANGNRVRAVHGREARELVRRLKA